MKIKSGFMLRNVIDSWVVVPLGERVVDFNGLITLNETGAYLWEQLKEETEKENLIKALLSEYDVDEKTASEDVEKFIAALEQGGLLS